MMIMWECFYWSYGRSNWSSTCFLQNLQSNELCGGRSVIFFQLMMGFSASGFPRLTWNLTELLTSTASWSKEIYSLITKSPHIVAFSYALFAMGYLALKGFQAVKLDGLILWHEAVLRFVLGSLANKSLMFCLQLYYCWVLNRQILELLQPKLSFLGGNNQLRAHFICC